MADPRELQCSLCRKEAVAWLLTRCPTCGSAVCQKCASLAYGRSFCSRRCAEYFFHGEADDDHQHEG